MTTISGVNSAALLILQQSNSINSSPENRSSSEGLLATANGGSEKVGLSAQPGQAQSRISEAMFSVNNVNVNQLKLELIERTGEELGFDKADFESQAEFAAAMRKQVINMDATGADARIAEIEKELGLDKLGISLLDVVSSARNPELEDKLTRALQEQKGMASDEAKAEEEASAPFAIAVDEIGIYGNSNVG